MSGVLGIRTAVPVAGTVSQAPIAGHRNVRLRRSRYRRDTPVKVPRKRLDVALVERGLAPTRAKAQALVMARRVRINDEFSTKPGTPVNEEDRLEITELDHPWVGRGGVKLAGALEAFAVDPRGWVCIDVGASTGGFTHVLLEYGAARVHAVDVGYGQLDASLRDDPRVVLRERVNARYLEPADFDEPADLVTIDVSFISLRLILPAVVPLVRPGGLVIMLIKPQFEVGRAALGKGGIVRDAGARTEVVEGIESFAISIGLKIRGVIESPIRGAEGNVEFLMCAGIPLDGTMTGAGP